MGVLAPHTETKEQLILTLPSDLALKITDKAAAMHVSVDAAAAVLLTYGLKVQEENERAIAQLVDTARWADADQRASAIDALGESIFGR